jgi:hypothetical protein
LEAEACQTPVLDPVLVLREQVLVLGQALVLREPGRDQVRGPLLGQVRVREQGHVHQLVICKDF